jgi:hypothetical protein
MSDVTCAEFAEWVHELALDLVGEPDRGPLLEHARSCPTCAQLLDDLVRQADELLLLAPSIEPPAGFEVRVLAAIGHEPAEEQDSTHVDATVASLGDHATDAPVAAPERLPGRSRHGVLRVVAVAASIVVLVGVGALGSWALTRHQHSTPVAGPLLRWGTVVTGDGIKIGHVQTIGGATPYLLVTVDHPRPGPDTVSCELVLADGTVHPVGTWNYQEVSTGVWAVGIDQAEGWAVRMNVRTADGTVVATALLQ